MLRVKDQLKLSSLAQSEAPAYFQLITQNQQYLGKWLPWALKVTTLADQERITHTAVLADRQQPKQFSIYWQGRLVRRISFVELDMVNRTAEIGYWLSEDAQGHGIMCACVDRLARYGLEALHLNRIDLKIATQNQSSLKVAAACDFERQEILPNAIHLLNGPVDAIRWSRFNVNND
ncbi:hypothetical protein FD35_GL001241 [Furfurilactobacillus rossiae DSM 15814]|uniref:N-acetyltransferase domain-containing protein n=2 Tax=Furfurilactobacillus rossiae TaxID=231049 RepID=A0A0R1RKI2_9LACO|nr:hypothetical protein FD35_GL001241 [Furfurilactobacillus rossiae DSM 15814]